LTSGSACVEMKEGRHIDRVAAEIVAFLSHGEQTIDGLYDGLPPADFQYVSDALTVAMGHGNVQQHVVSLLGQDGRLVRGPRLLRRSRTLIERLCMVHVCVMPVRLVEFHILLNLAVGERHGYGTVQDIDERGDTPVPDIGTMYRALARRVEERFIERRRGSAPHAGDELSRLSAARRAAPRVGASSRRASAIVTRRPASLMW
jgi:hypothetical protein